MGLNYKLINKPSTIDGTGSFAMEKIPARKKIGEMTGEVITLREARRRVKTTKRIAMVEFGDGRALDGSGKNGNELRYINHSCQPNSYMRVAYGRVEFYSLRAIKNGEELTCNYGPTHHDGQLRCRCGMPGCIGFL